MSTNPTSPCILVAEENASDAESLVQSLQKAGYQVRRASDGYQAVEIATHDQPDAILLDISMPGRDGLEVCKILKHQESTKSIPIIFVTSISNSQQIRGAFQTGGCDYVTKPFQTDEVLARVSVQVRLKRAETELLEKNKQTRELSQKLTDANVELAVLSRIDPLTKTFNRRAWEDAAAYEHERFLQNGNPYSILIIDVDLFKVFNDLNGHQAGDEALCRLVEAIVSSCRSSDLVGRYGGERFLVLAAETPADVALQLADRIRKAIWNLAIPHQAGVVDARITASIGIATSGAELWNHVLRKSDEALYVAKRSGRNMVYADNSFTSASAFQDGTSQNTDSLSEADSKAAQTTVLVVDDDPTNRALCNDCLIREGYHTLEAKDGHEALSTVARTIPDVIIMGTVMPNMDGLECTRRLKANLATRDIPIIMLSAQDAGDDLLSGLEAGADEYLSMPIQAKELVLRVHSMASSYRERKNLLKSYQERGEQTRALGLLLEYSRSVGQADLLDAVFEQTIAIAAELTGSRCISILLPDQENRFLSVVKSVGIESSTASCLHIPMGGDISGQVYKTRETLIINNQVDANRHASPYDSDLFVGTPLVSTPLGTADQAVGVLNISQRAGARPFCPSELEYINLISNIAGSSIRDLSVSRERDEAYDSIVVALAKLAEHRDNETGRHLERVTIYSIILAEQIGSTDLGNNEIDSQFLQSLKRSVPLHDIGKVAIPDYILLKPGKLTPEEWVIMKTHAEIGAKTIQSVRQRAPSVTFLHMAEDIALFHHEWYDGSGYPTSLKGNAIPLSARIVAVSDVYDALTTKRVYKEAISHEKAVAIIQDSTGKQFDPTVVGAFMEHKEEFAELARSLADNQPPPLLKFRRETELVSVEESTPEMAKF